MPTPLDVNTSQRLEQFRGRNPHMAWNLPVPQQTPIPQPAGPTHLPSSRVSLRGFPQVPAAQQVASLVLQTSPQRSRQQSLPTGQMGDCERKLPNHDREPTPMPRSVSSTAPSRPSVRRTPLYTPPGAPMREGIGE